MPDKPQPPGEHGTAPLEVEPQEPGSRTGEGTQSIIPHLQKQQQVQVLEPLPKPEQPT
jgi:hypothetical protein